jgi:septation ring formation regulator
MELINVKMLKTEEKLNGALKTLGGLKEDENRAREQLSEIKEILNDTKEKARSYKLPLIPKNYYVELGEAMEAINNMTQELDKRPISIKTLNTRVDTARDLVLKVYNTINESIKTAKMAETAIVYGNRYRPSNKEVDFGLTKAENAFYKGNFKNSLENAINAINIVEPGIHERLLKEYK